jgi:hypothetical protein
MHTHTLVEPMTLEQRHHVTLLGEVCGNWSWVPYRGVASVDLWALLEAADIMYETRWYAELIREELKRRQAQGIE